MAAIGAAVMATVMATGRQDCGRPAHARDRYGYSRYDHDRPDPAANGDCADRYYRDGPSYRERRPGGAPGTAIPPGGSGLPGALIGGALAGESIDRNTVRCR